MPRSSRPITVTLGDLQDLVARRVKSGAYASASEVVRAGLLALYRRIAAAAGTEMAGASIDRIEAACLALETFPARGTKRDDIRPGLRTMGFERRATIVFRITGRAVLIVRIFHGGQDFARALRGEAEA